MDHKTAAWRGAAQTRNADAGSRANPDPLHPITDRSKVFDGSIAEYRGLEIPACSFDGDVLRGIDTTYHLKNLIFEGKDVYKSDSREIMLKFAENNGGAKFGLGVLFFENLTITSNGFFYGRKGFYRSGYDPGQDERTVSVYRAHSFDFGLAEYKNIDLRKYK